MNTENEVLKNDLLEICRTQLEGREWMREWPASISLSDIAAKLRPLAGKLIGTSAFIPHDEVLSLFLTDQAAHMLVTLRNEYCVWLALNSIVENKTDWDDRITLPVVVSTLETRKDIPRSLKV